MKIVIEKTINYEDIIESDFTIKEDDSLSQQINCHYIGDGFIEYGINPDIDDNNNDVPFVTIDHVNYYLNEFIRIDKHNNDTNYYFNYFDGYMTTTNSSGDVLKFDPTDNEHVFIYSIY